VRFSVAPGPAIGAVVDFLYPPRCLVCSSPLGGRSEGVCPACRASIATIDRSHDAWRTPEEKFLEEGLVEGLHSLYLFEKSGVLQQLLHQMKYGGMHSLGVRFGVELGRALDASGRISVVDMVVPVPLHGAKLRERGYNQSRKICEGIMAATGVPIGLRALKRTRHTPSQTTLKLHEREANVRGAFLVPRGSVQSVRGASILLVDDVLTTGATLRSCARALKDAGASSVLCATVAIAP
jgi:ComF family protein